MKRLAAIFLVLLAGPAWAGEIVSPLRAITSFMISNVLTSVASTLSTPFGSQTRIVRTVCSVDCFVAFPVSPIVSAATVPVYLKASDVFYFRVSPGAHVQVYANSATGILYISEMSE